MSPTDAGRGSAARGATQLSLFDESPPRVRARNDAPPAHRLTAPAPAIASVGRLPDDASLWAISFAGDTRGPEERVAEASARYRARFGRAHALVAVPLAELDAYRAAGVAALGDGRLAGGCVYLLHPPAAREREMEGTA